MTENSLKELCVRDLMTADPITVSPDISIRRVLALMNEASIRHLPVVDEHGIIGLVSNRDLAFLYAIPGVVPEFDEARTQELLEAPVGVVMKSRFLVERDVLSVAPGDELAEAVDLFLSAGVGALPVLDESGQVVGILSTVDIMRWVGDDILGRQV